MHIPSNPLPAAHQAPEPPRPVQHEAQESSRPVLAPNQTEAAAQELRRNDERRVGHRDGGKEHGVHARREAAKHDADNEPKPSSEPRRHRNADLAVGSLLDVFA